MASYNKIIIIGNLGRDPESRMIDSSRKVVSFSVATNKSYTKRNGEKVDQTEWFRVSLWNNLADVAEKYLKKGSQVYIEGELSTNTYTDKNGEQRFSLEVLAQNMTLLGNGSSDNASGAGYNQALKEQDKLNEPIPADLQANDDDDDLPF